MFLYSFFTLMNTNRSFKQNKEEKQKEKQKKKKNTTTTNVPGGKESRQQVGWLDRYVFQKKPTSNCKFYIDILVQQVCIICHIKYIWRYVEVTYNHHFSVKYLLQTSRPIVRLPSLTVESSRSVHTSSERASPDSQPFPDVTSEWKGPEK